MKKNIINFKLPSLKEAARRSKEDVEIIRDSYHASDTLKDIVKGRRYFVSTFGCQANERDEEFIKGILEDLGYIKSDDVKASDLIILNTCAIRENAESRVFGELGHLKALKRNNPDLIIGICGCMVQQEDIVSKLLQKYQQVDLIFGTHNIVDLPQMLEDIYLYNNEKVVDVYSIEGSVYEDLPSKRNSDVKAWVNIMYGCDKFCTYCIVPYTRGKERSRLKEDILKEVLELKDLGYQEITLLGQNVNAYGKDLNYDYAFADLLVEVAKTGIPRIRFTTSHPWDFTKEMVEAIAAYPNIMPHVHLPLQSGDSNTLRRMGRRYTYEQYFDLYTSLRDRVKDVSITTDIIVGFPNETEEEFENTLEAMKECEFDGAFTFIFSARPNTPAARMNDDVSMETKKERFKRLIKIVADSANKRNKEFLGKTILVLVDGPSKKNKEVLSGYSEHNKLVNFKGQLNLVGKIVKVKITKTKTWTLEGEYCE